MWSLSLLTALIPLPFWTGQYGLDVNDVCWIAEDKATVHHNINFYQLGLYYIPSVLIVLFSVAVLIKVSRAFRRGLPDTLATRERILRQSRVYLYVISAYLAANVIAWSVHIGFIVTNGSRNNVLLWTFVALRSLRGITDFIAWTLNNSSSFAALQTVILRPFRSCCRRNAVTSATSLISTADQLFMEAQRKREEAAQRETINQALRREIMLCTTWGIADALEQHAPSDGDGLLRRATTLRKRHRTIHLPSTIGRHAFEFSDYESELFLTLRKEFSVRDPEYVRSFTISNEGQSTAMLEKFTEGRSGSFFYFTYDHRYIVKTVTKAERRCLQHFLPEYATYIKSQPDTLLTRFMGLHAVRVSPEQAKIYFVVMSNIFSAAEAYRINQVYDLKGSTVQRRVLKRGEEADNAGTLKDLDLRRHIHIGPDAKAALELQLHHDVAFLNSINIMDYSLLVGIHDCSARHDHCHQHESVDHVAGSKAVCCTMVIS